MQKNLKIAYYRKLFIGDCIIALDSIYAIKALYPQAHLCVYTGDIGQKIFGAFSFIDEIINIQHLHKNDIVKSIDSKNFDYLILTQPNRLHTSIASKSNAKVIISFMMWHNIFRRFLASVFGGVLHSVFGVRLRSFRRVFYSRSFGGSPNYKRLLSLVRQIDSRIYDSHIKSIDFSPASFPFSHTHKEFVESKLAFLTSLPTRTLQTRTFKILLNPYSNSCSHSLTLQGYATLANALSKALPNAQIIISTPPYAPSLPNLSTTTNIHIFSNNQDLYNLIELVRQMDLVISPSTGVIHIANNLAIPMLCLFSKTDLRLWLGKNMDKDMIITLKCPTKKLTQDKENQIIQQVLQKVLARCKNT